MHTTTMERREWLIPAGLIALSLVPAIAGTARLAQLADAGKVTSENARFFAMPLPVVLHILSAIPFGIIGAFQFTPAVRRRHRALHRAAGRVLVVCGALAAISGLWMTLAYPWPAPDGLGVYLLRLVFGGLMLVSVALGVAAIVRRDFTTHGAWMTRAYAVGMGAGTQVFTHLPWFVLVGQPGETARTVMMGLGWVINVAVAEYVLHRKSSSSSSSSPQLNATKTKARTNAVRASRGTPFPAAELQSS